MIASFTIPGMKLVSEANAHEHWRVRQKRAKMQRSTAELLTRANVRVQWSMGPIVVRIVRIAPRALDSDNLVGSGKHIRDGIADGLGINDRDPRVDWVVLAEKSAAGVYGARVEVCSRLEEAERLRTWAEVLP